MTISFVQRYINWRDGLSGDSRLNRELNWPKMMTRCTRGAVPEAGRAADAIQLAREAHPVIEDSLKRYRQKFSGREGAASPARRRE